MRASQIQQRCVFVDCGGHCGESIALARKLFGKKLTVYCFEPVPSLAQRLTLFWENDPKVKIIEAAVSNKTGKAPLYLSSAFTDGSSLIAKKKTGKLVIGKPVVAKTIRLSNWIVRHLKEFDSIYLKLDVEGAEFEILDDLINSGVIRRIEKIFVEWHDHKLTGKKYIKWRVRLERHLERIGLKPESWNPPRRKKGMVLGRPKQLLELQL